MDLASRFGDAVRRHREIIRLSQEELAARAGLDRTYISGVERSARNPTLKVMQRLSAALGVDLDVLFGTARELATTKNAQERG
jgi:transcriptional regulator with XRE-family HTH domain